MLKPGDTFDRYTIDAAIAQGGMGAVYRAHDTRLDRRVALKVLSDGVDRAGGDGDARLLREARAAAALDHPNAVSIFDVGERDGATYIVMELVSGRTLREVVGDASVPVATRVSWLTDVARALAAAHRRGLVHRDIKPENVMVRDDGVVKVLDFGIARRAAAGQVDPSAPTQVDDGGSAPKPLAPALPTLTRTGVKVGTPVYMAPEQIRGDVLDGRADQFAWGVLAFELLTGKLPWRGAGEPLAVVASILTDEVPAGALARAGVPAEVAAVVQRALSKKPEARFASTDDLVRALDAAGKREAGERSLPLAEAPPAATTGATSLQRYSTEEVREILERAVEQQEAKRADSRLGFDDLLAAAREVGVDPAVLREASRDLRARRQEQENEGAARDAWIRRKRRKFYNHLGIWAIFSIAFLLVAHSPAVPLFWGIAVALQGFQALMAGEDEWREEREKQERRGRRRQRREQVVERVLNEGAAALITTGAALRQRVAAPPTATRARVAATDTEAGREEEEAAEAEAAAAAEKVQVERRRR